MKTCPTSLTFTLTSTLAFLLWWQACRRKRGADIYCGHHLPPVRPVHGAHGPPDGAEATGRKELGRVPVHREGEA